MVFPRPILYPRRKKYNTPLILSLYYKNVRFWYIAKYGYANRGLGPLHDAINLIKSNLKQLDKEV